MTKAKIYRTLRIEENIFLDLKDFKRQFEYENRKDLTWSELFFLLIENRPLKINK